MEYNISISSDKIVIEEKLAKYQINLDERLLQFSVDMVRFCLGSAGNGQNTILV